MSTNMFGMVVIPDGVIITKYNGNRKKVTIPEELDGYPVVAIDRNAFRGTLVEHVVGKSIKRIGKYAFADTKMLKEVDFPFLEKIDDFAFSKSALKRFFVGPHVSCFLCRRLWILASNATLWQRITKCIEQKTALWLPVICWSVSKEELQMPC